MIATSEVGYADFLRTEPRQVHLKAWYAGLLKRNQTSHNFKAYPSSQIDAFHEIKKRRSPVYILICPKLHHSCLNYLFKLLSPQK